MNLIATMISSNSMRTVQLCAFGRRRTAAAAQQRTRRLRSAAASRAAARRSRWRPPPAPHGSRRPSPSRHGLHLVFSFLDPLTLQVWLYAGLKSLCGKSKRPMKPTSSDGCF